MNTHNYISSPAPTNFSFATLQQAWHDSVKASPAMAYTGAVFLIASLFTLVLSFIDPRLFQGISVWHKPWKFLVSTGLYTLNLALFMSFLPTLSKASWARRYIVWITVATGIFEVVYITWQGAFGLASHYNVSTPFYGHMYTAMGIAAVLLTSTSGVLGYQILRNKAKSFTQNLALRHAIGWGLVLTSVLGIVTGGVLGERTRSGGHWVGGTANDGLGMAVFNWSRDGGDLRVAHFFALHAMQFLPLFALILLAVLPKLNQAAAKRIVWLMAIVFSVFCIFTLLQALRGIPFLA